MGGNQTCYLRSGVLLRTWGGGREGGRALPWVFHCGINALKGEQEQAHLLSWKNSSLRRCPRGVQGCHFNHRAGDLQRAALL